MSNPPRPISRREFLKLAGLGAGTLALRPFRRGRFLQEFPDADRLGRNCTGGMIPIKTRPDVNSTTIKEVYEDTVFPWLREVAAETTDYSHINQRWVETPEGFVYAASLQPCRNLPNSPLTSIPDSKSGFWAEVTVPFVDLFMDNPPPRSPWAKEIIDYGSNPRLYYSQVVWIDQIKAGTSGQMLYRFNEDGGRPSGVTGGSYGDIFWADASAFRPLTSDEVTPIHPDVDPVEKIIKVNLTYQTLSCLEGKKEVYFCRVSTGAKFDAYGNAVSAWATPPGDSPINRKAISIHMSGGSTGAGYDTPAVSWTALFAPGGIAVHAAFWHNDFGSPRSHGCVNATPEDAKWIFRWTAPEVSLDAGDLTWDDWQSGSTHVAVEERLY
jgi:hypothetical protein